MNTKILKQAKYAAFALILAGSLHSCSKEMNDEDEIVTDPEEAILGKWELVRLTRTDQNISYTPTGYVEYLTDGQFAWYDYTTKKYTLFEGKYWLDKSYEYSEYDHKENDWILHYENHRAFYENCKCEWDKYVYHLDKPGGNNFLFKFINQNTMSLYCLDFLYLTTDFSYFYKRKK